MSNNVHVWEENVTIPTYKVYPPEKGPLFIENRAYQGSSGKVYPLPVTEKISDKKEDVSYHAIYLENDYLKVMADVSRELMIRQTVMTLSTITM